MSINFSYDVLFREDINFYMHRIVFANLFT